MIGIWISAASSNIAVANHMCKHISRFLTPSANSPCK